LLQDHENEINRLSLDSACEALRSAQPDPVLLVYQCGDRVPPGHLAEGIRKGVDMATMVEMGE
jgi:hypothetical protein